jgi:DinB superfamily
MTSAPDPSPRTPDALEELRRDRGEGWQWHRIQMEPCPQCGDHPASLAPSSLGPLGLERARAWREFLSDADDDYLRTSPEFGVFSPIQYGAHVRDIVRVYTDRMVLGLERDAPTVPIFNPPQEEWERYNRLDAAELGEDVIAQAQRLADLASGMEPDNWRRIVVNDRGVYGVYSFTLAGLACNAVHETHHHLLDATGALEQASTG